MIRNSILDRWEKVRIESRGAAIFSAGGEILRSWDEIEAEAGELRGQLEGDCGAVSIQTGNVPSVPGVLLACWRTGRPVVLLDCELLGEDRRQVESSLGVTLRITAHAGGALAFVDVTSPPAPPSRACLYKVTAGQDGGLRVVGFTAEQLLADCDQVADAMGIGRGDVSYGAVSFAHSYGFSSLLTVLLCRGVPFAIAGDVLPWALVRGVECSKASVLPLVPAMFRALLSIESLPPTLRLCISAGAALAPQLGAEFHRKFGRKIHSFYGTTECGGICYDSSDEVPSEPGFVGTPLCGVRVELASPEASGGSRARVWSNAMGIGVASAQGAFEPPDVLLQQGAGFRIVRCDSPVLNVAGKKVHPAEIESVLKKVPGVADAVVWGVPDLQRGEEICALIISPQPVDAVAVRRHCANCLPPWQVPRRILTERYLPEGLTDRSARAAFAAGKVSNR